MLRAPLDDVRRLFGVVAELAGDELFLDEAAAALIDLVLVDVAAGDEEVTRPESLLDEARGRVVHNDVVVCRVELDEGVVRLVTPLLDTDPETDAVAATRGSLQVEMETMNPARLIWVGMDMLTPGAGAPSK